MGIIVCNRDFNFHSVALCFVPGSIHVKTVAVGNISR